LKLAALKGALRALCRSQPLNSIATTAVRACLRAGGFEPGLVATKLRRVGGVWDRLPNGCILRLWTEDDDLIPNEVFWRGWRGFEPETLPLFFELACGSRVTLDIGAHIGIYALSAAHANPHGRVYAFEAMPATCRRLERNIRLNQLSNLQCVEGAVSDFDGSADFFYNTGLELNAEASLRADCTGAFARFSSVGEICKTTVRVRTVDSFARENCVSGIDLVKLDVEGAEPQALRGMVDVLRAERPTIVCEVLKGFGTEGQVEEVLGHLGYRYYLLTRQGPLLRNRIQGQPEEQWHLRNYLLTTLSPDEVAALRCSGGGKP
jgi:FkbM family methyltransferase